MQATIEKFSSSGFKLSRSTAIRFKELYERELEKLHESTKLEKLSADAKLPKVEFLKVKERGRNTMLPAHIDSNILSYILTLRSKGCLVTTLILLAAAKAIVMKTNPSF